MHSIVVEMTTRAWRRPQAGGNGPVRAAPMSQVWVVRGLHAQGLHAPGLIFSSESRVELTLLPDGGSYSSSSSALPPLHFASLPPRPTLPCRRAPCVLRSACAAGEDPLLFLLPLPSPFYSSSPPRKVRTRRNFSRRGHWGAWARSTVSCGAACCGNVPLSA